ncbi:LacI family DNA-binding transcriptional regulator [Clostridium fungisolvens]|uniref:HTH-type transcriptional repressor PurR n=1 Tax=Clostridium fungisolvens TaxID=1604897 RepID=A0A6V8SHL0_9CLOT|nr:LacI family DNA-binding transcriptional regulator [Clostridium fungisolvens]GFP76657.1 HTH-type transcriptional repressor PurR [Clostridium fungisolvens]
MRDVAKAAGVSVATVSYVINNNEKESIPEDTRIKVINAIEHLGYVPNLTARALTRKKSGLIGVFIMSSDLEHAPWRLQNYSQFISELVKMLYDHSYHVIIEYLGDSKKDLNIIRERALDAVFLVDINAEEVYDTASMFKVPIIIVDNFIEDTIFHKVLIDYKSAIDEGIKILQCHNPYIIVDSENSKSIIERLYDENNCFKDNIYVVRHLDSFYKFLKDKKQSKFIIFNEFLAVLAKEHIDTENAVAICISGNDYLLEAYKNKIYFNNKRKAKVSVDIILDYINKRYHENKFTFIEPGKR